jgi:hypothetical protein
MARRTATQDKDRRPQIAGEPADEVMTPHGATDDYEGDAAGGEQTTSATGTQAALSEPTPPARRGRAASRRRGGTGAAADGAASGAEAAAATPAEQQPRRPGRPGTVAAQTHTAVEDLVRAEGLTKAQAFERLGAESGRRPGTVAAAYYRAARNAAARAGTRGPGRRAGTRGRQGGDGAMTALETASAALQELVELVRRQEQELAQLRAESERYGEIRAIIDGGSTPARRGRRRSEAS